MRADTIKSDVGHGRLVAVVEDNERNARLIEQVLSAHGFLVATFEDGRTAIDRIDASTASVLLIDIQLPDMDGVALLRHLRANGVPTPAIAVTAYAMDGDSDRFLAAGFDHYLSKPLDIRSLADTVAGLIRGEP